MIDAVEPDAKELATRKVRLASAASLALPAIAMGRFIDLSHQVVEGMETYRPLPTPVVEIIVEIR